MRSTKQKIKARGWVAADGHLRVDVATTLPEGEHDVLVVVESTLAHAESQRQAWRKLIGRLEWRGDPIAEQRRLRDEW